MKIQGPEIGVLLAAVLVGELIVHRVLPMGLRPDLSLVAVLFVGWNSSPLKGAAAGTAFGLVRDYILGIYLGLNGLSKTVLGYAAAYLNRWVASENRLLRAALLTILSCLDRIIVYVMLSMFGRSLPDPYWFYAVMEALVTGLVGESFFRFYSRVKVPPKNFRRLGS